MLSPALSSVQIIHILGLKSLLQDQFKNAPELIGGIGMRLMEKMGWKPGQGLGFFSEYLERIPKRESVLDPTGKNPVSVLMEVCSRNRWMNPEFVCDEMGPHNNRRYLWKAVLNGVEYSPSLPSSNKKAGKAQVCMVVLEALGFGYLKIWFFKCFILDFVVNILI
ncbi:unnamed protein product [Meloidogyne enterolobii]|uniref:Uncharacterized protein n=1 Tax=Meloidogyne enterolobii TaxID=390850 RepID=A0ACB0YB68_MELEN